MRDGAGLTRLHFRYNDRNEPVEGVWIYVDRVVA
jgi:hypothetical protein